MRERRQKGLPRPSDYRAECRAILPKFAGEWGNICASVRELILNPAVRQRRIEQPRNLKPKIGSADGWLRFKVAFQTAALELEDDVDEAGRKRILMDSHTLTQTLFSRILDLALHRVEEMSQVEQTTTRFKSNTSCVTLSQKAFAEGIRTCRGQLSRRSLRLSMDPDGVMCVHGTCQDRSGSA